MKAEDLETERLEAQVESRRHRAEARRNHAESKRFLARVNVYYAKGDNRSAGVATHLAEFYRLLAEANSLNAEAKSIEAKALRCTAESKRSYAEAKRLEAEAAPLYAETKHLCNRVNGIDWWWYPTSRRERIAKARGMVAEARRLESAANRIMAKAERLYIKGDNRVDEANRLYAEANRLHTEADRYFAESQPHFDEAKRLEDLDDLLDYNYAKETKTSNVPTYRIKREQKGQVKNNQISKKKKRIPSFLKGEKKLVELLEYFEKNAILTSDWHKKNINQEEKKKINEELIYLNKEIRKYPSNSLFQRRVKQRAIKEYGKAFDDLNKSSSLLQKRAELWMIKKEYKKALADLNNAKRKKEMAEKIKKTKTTGENKQKCTKKLKPKELQDEQKNTKKAEQKEQQKTNKEDNIEAAKGCGCLFVLVLIAIGAWGYFFGTDESTVNRILTCLWELPDWIKWSLMLLLGIAGIFAIQDTERQNGKKKEANKTIMVGVCLLILILAGFWLYFFGTGEPASNQIIDMLTWLWELPVWITLPLCLLIVIAGVASEEGKVGCGAVIFIGLVSVAFWVLFF